jgi:CubicO group peptidase (beta-lactamase class C family)
MQLLLTDVTGQSFPELMRLNLLEPLGMRRSFYQQPLQDTLSHEAALAHDIHGKRFSIPWKIYPELAAAGLWSTANDLAELVRSLQKTADGDAVMPLSKQLVRDLLRPVGIGSFGTGFNVYQQGEGWYFSHMGANQGYRSFLIGHQSKGYGLVVMTNSDGGFALIERICKRIQQSYNWDVLEPQRSFHFGTKRGLGCLPEFAPLKTKP